MYFSEIVLHMNYKSEEIGILQIKSCDNLVDLLIKYLPLTTFNKCVKCIDIHRLKYFQSCRENSL
jgi:hypothetical protein